MIENKKKPNRVGRAVIGGLVAVVGLFPWSLGSRNGSRDFFDLGRKVAYTIEYTGDPIIQPTIDVIKDYSENVADFNLMGVAGRTMFYGGVETIRYQALMAAAASVSRFLRRLLYQEEKKK